MPDALLGPQRQRTDDLGERLKRGLGRRAADASADLARAAGSLRPALLSQRFAQAQARLDQLWRVAVTLNPDNVLARGYARVEKRGGGTLATAGAARGAKLLTLRFADGVVDARVEQGGAPAYKAPKPEQPDLF
jgi:exodeoxyribonuclease VII large subunit